MVALAGGFAGGILGIVIVLYRNRSRFRAKDGA